MKNSMSLKDLYCMECDGARQAFGLLSKYIKDTDARTTNILSIHSDGWQIGLEGTSWKKEFWKNREEIFEQIRKHGVKIGIESVKGYVYIRSKGEGK